MKLLSIKAHGFKSFADKIEIIVGDGITGIVGPNGSGKSNVVDAVKWVLGESSLKELRGGDTGTDIIFNGSKSRNALTRAWVSLTFDNSDHYLQSEYDEIEVKRVVYSTGENEYFINNTKVRKKDITDLFIDSGASASSFSIISQGKISEILKGRPVDRRVIIEEAAGVLKYKKRKEETLRKLDNTNDNLEKVNLVIQELEVNLDPLREQAEVAKKYLEYKNELEGIEIALLASDIKHINDEYKTKKDNIARLNEELMNMDNSNSIDNTKLEGLKAKSLKLDEQILKLSDNIMKLTDSLSALETKKQVISERRKYEVDDQKLENNIMNLKEEEVLLKKNISVVNNEIKRLDTEYNKINETLSNYSDEYKNLMVKKNTLNQELSLKNREENSLKNKIELLNDQLDNDTKIPYAVKSVLNNPRLNGIHDVLCRLIETKEEYVTAIEIGLGSSANVIVIDDEKCAKNAINYLKDNKLGRATFFPLSIIKEKYVDPDTLEVAKSVPGFIDIASNLVTYNPLYKGIVLNQLGNTLVVNNIDTMNLLGKKINYRYRIITLDGEVQFTGGALSGGINKQSNGLLNARFELENLNKKLENTINEEKLIEEHINQIDYDLKVLEGNIFDTKTNLTEKNEQKEVKNNNLNELNKKLSDVQGEISGTNNLLNNSLDKEYNEVLEEYLKVSTEKEERILELNSIKSDKSEILSEIGELESLNRKANSEYNKLANSLKEEEVSIARMDVKLDTLVNRLSEEYQITYEKASHDYELEMDANIARTKVNHLRRDIKELGEVNVGSISEYERINTRYTFLSNQKVDLENAIKDLLEIINDLDETMKMRFEETYNKVNVEFGKVFKKLFKGGNASLQLTDPNNLLETGIDITAEPPGKSLKNITSLSGGEMTLTTIALLFSILNIRPVPFCILDEVEAALDEANVDQFGNYIKDYETSSQFIVITHKKRTMEYADTLYGITMQESGVSKLVSVRLENIKNETSV